MAEYQRANGDVAYRTVRLDAMGISEFTDFERPGETVRYDSRDQVLEVLHANGETSLHYALERVQLYFKPMGTDQILLSKCPTEHLWLRAISGGASMMYKVPSGLPLNGMNLILNVPGNSGRVELCGDKYFEAAFCFD